MATTAFSYITIPYWTNIQRKKVPKSWIGAGNFVRQKFLSTENFARRNIFQPKSSPKVFKSQRLMLSKSTSVIMNSMADCVGCHLMNPLTFPKGEI